ncbi:hypothetical protein HWV62_12104 [Athelia sp. TMB]|nr:hypothetical protein HWV62_12104 [Athelia sp. TMB]
MPTARVYAVWAAPLFASNGALWKDAGTMSLYGLRPDHFAADKVAGVSTGNLANLRLFVAHAMGITGEQERTSFLNGEIDHAAATAPKGKSKKKAKTTAQALSDNTSDGLGRKHFASWFSAAKINDKINETIDAWLRAANAHPQQVIKAQAEAVRAGAEPVFRGLPPKDGSINDNAPALASALYGPSAYNDILAAPLPHCRAAILSIGHHTWERYRKSRAAAKTRWSAAQAHYLEKESGDGRALIKAVQRYIEIATWNEDLSNEENGLDEARAFLAEMMSHLTQEDEDVPGQPAATARGRRRAKKILSIHPLLATEAEVQIIRAIYLDVFQKIQSRDDGEEQIVLDDLPIADAMDANGDLGVARWATYSHDQLAALLHWTDKRPPTFAAHRSANHTAWDDVWLDPEFATDNADVSELTMMWHQTAGVCAMMDMFFTETKLTARPDPDIPGEPTCPGLMLADSVGLGKTAQVIGLISTLLQVREAQTMLPVPGPVPPIIATHAGSLREAAGRGSRGHLTPPSESETIHRLMPRAALPCRLPPCSTPPRSESDLRASKPWFAGIHNVIPDLPHAIVAPTSLVDQWGVEFSTFCRKGSVEVYKFPTKATEWPSFWTNPNGAWMKSIMPMSKRIVIIQHSTVAQMASKAYSFAKPAHKGYATSKERIRKQNYSPMKSWLIWERKWCTVVVDEAHTARTVGRLFHGLNMLLGQSCVKLLTTATPLQHTPKDISNLGRLLRIEGLCGEDGDEMDKENENLVKRKKKELRDIAKEESTTVSHLVAHMSGTSTAGSRVYQELNGLTMGWLSELSASFGGGKDGRIIRRSNDSRQPGGQSVMSDLPPLVVSPIVIKLKPEEYDRLAAVTRGRGEEKKAMASWDQTSENFYLPLRLTLACPEPWGDDDDGRPDVYRSLDDFEARAGNKLITAVKVTKHLLTHDDIGIPDFTGEVHVYPDPPACPDGEECPRTRKLLLYHEFTMMADLIQSALSVSGVESIVYNGAMKLAERTKALAEFRASSTHRVLLMSKVGTVGLNLTCADVAIAVDVPWSQIDLEQFWGRVHRFGQKRPVYGFLLVAHNSFDQVMFTGGRGKVALLDIFLVREENKSLVMPNFEADNVLAPDNPPKLEEEVPGLHSRSTTPSEPPTPPSNQQDKGKRRAAPTLPRKRFNGKTEREPDVKNAAHESPQKHVEDPPDDAGPGGTSPRADASRLGHWLGLGDDSVRPAPTSAGSISRGPPGPAAPPPSDAGLSSLLSATNLVENAPRATASATSAASSAQHVERILQPSPGPQLRRGASLLPHDGVGATSEGPESAEESADETISEEELEDGSGTGKRPAASSPLGQPPCKKFSQPDSARPIAPPLFAIPAEPLVISTPGKKLPTKPNVGRSAAAAARGRAKSGDPVEKHPGLRHRPK